MLTRHFKTGETMPILHNLFFIKEPGNGRRLALATIGLTLLFARMHAGAGDAVPCAGMLAHAVLCVAHARMAERREWVLNEKRLVCRAGLEGVQDLIGAETGLPESVAALAGALGVEPLAPR